jgi:hypothetical protein
MKPPAPHASAVFFLALYGSHHIWTKIALTADVDQRLGVRVTLVHHLGRYYHLLE